MKTLILIRHADSTPAAGAQDDFDRPLSKKGEKDAAVMGQRLSEYISSVDIAISSPALRARTTADIIRQNFKHKSFPLQLAPSLYEAPVNDYYAVLESQADSLESIAIVAHNPGISYFILEHVSQSFIDMPPGAIFGFEIATNNWSDIRLADWKPIFYIVPEHA